MTPVLIAHRGDSAHAPENTLAAFEAAAARGADWIELDLQLSSDGEVVVFHDESLWRLARRRQRVADLPAAELTAVDVSRRHGNPSAAATIPTLAAVLASVGRRLPLYLELKSPGGGLRRRRNHDLLAACLRAVPRRARHALASFDAGLVRAALAAGRRSVLIAREASALQRLSAPERRRLYAVSLHHAALSPSLVVAVHRQGIRLWTWTVDGDRRLRRALDLGVDGVCCNDVASARALLDTGAPGPAGPGTSLARSRR